MLTVILGGLSAGHVRQHEKYLLEDERWLVAEPFFADDLGSEFVVLRSIAREHAPGVVLARGVTSFADGERIGAKAALSIAREVVAETPFIDGAGAFVVHGPPREPTRTHVHYPFSLVVGEQTFSKADARRALRAASEIVAARHGLTVPHSQGERFHLRTARAAQVWQTTPTLYSWIEQTVLPRLVEDLERGASWQSIDCRLRPFGLRYVPTPRGGGAFLDEQTGKAVRASAFDLRLARTELERRFGPLPAFAPVERTEIVEKTFVQAAAIADAGEMEKHRAARAAWSELYEASIARERAALDRMYGDQCGAIAAMSAEMTRAARASIPSDERRGVVADARGYRSSAVGEALANHTSAMRELYNRYPKKPSRKLHEWQKHRNTQHAPVGRIRAFDAREPQIPSAPWHAVPSPAGGLDLYYNRQRVAYDVGDSIAILDNELPDAAIATLALPERYRIEGPAPLRARIRDLGYARGDFLSDGGEPLPELEPLHALLPENPVARRCLALMDALRVRPFVDGIPYAHDVALPADPRRIELRSDLILVVQGANVDVVAAQFPPIARGEDVAIIRCADAYTAEQVRRAAMQAGVRTSEHLPASLHLQFTDAPIARAKRPTAIPIDRTLLQPDVDVALVPTPGRARGSRHRVPEQKPKRRR